MVAAAGYRLVEIRIRAANNAMILLNLRHGFHVAGFEVDARGIGVVTLAAQTALPAVDGSRLQPGTVCYAIARGETVMGATLQTVKRRPRMACRPRR